MNEVYCWMWTAASQARRTAPSAYAPRMPISLAAPVRESLANELVATAAARVRAVGAGGLGGDLAARRGEDVPGAAKRRYALTVGVARGLVALEAVERVAVVGHLPATVRALGGRHHRGLRPAADCGLAGRPQGRPVRGAGA